MSTPKFIPKFLILFIIIAGVAALRLASFYGNGPLTIFTPLGAMSLFGAAYFKDKLTPFLFPLLTLFISDVIVSFTLFSDYRVGLLYSGWYWTYSAFILMIIAARVILKHVNIRTVVLGILSTTVIHWLVTDLGLCIQENKFSGPLYVEKLITAIPYELKFMAGTALYSVILFGGFALLTKKSGAMKLSTSTKSI
ncbi:MAG: hypothetical protein EOO04_01335 [Chitinophagaceae bacterium]|nr:MAG: hypothetical protein EOO04_01335 [Chitinophagaceae bacterium]